MFKEDSSLGKLYQPSSCRHTDHSGGFTAVTKWFTDTAERQVTKPLVLDVHPDRPIRRGFKVPKSPVPVIPFNEDPTLEELAVDGLVEVATHKEPHLLLDSFFFVSGLIPRHTYYEKGMANHVKMHESGMWVDDPYILDERYLAVNIKGRGPIVFSACSHAGIVNVVTDVTQLAGRPVHAVVGGFHLSSSQCEDRIDATVMDLLKLNPALIVAGHCTGWRAKAALAQKFPGRFMPCVVGGKYRFTAAQS